LEGCRLGNCTFGKLPLGKYAWEVASWEYAFGKVPLTEDISQIEVKTIL